MRIAAQRAEEVLTYSGSLAAGAELSASLRARGHARLVGAIIANASGAAGSALEVTQSIDHGVNWDYKTACTVAACDIDNSGFSIEVIGDSVRVRYTNGDDIAASVRTHWYLRPV